VGEIQNPVHGGLAEENIGMPLICHDLSIKIKIYSIKIRIYSINIKMCFPSQLEQ